MPVDLDCPKEPVIPERARNDAVTSASPPVPAWYYLDNLFGSVEQMARAHAPIVAKAIETLAGRGGNVLDLGCGNGALLKKIRTANPRVVPCGIEREAERVAHARELLPDTAEHFIEADIFEGHALWESHHHFVLVILALRRLEQAGPEQAARLRAWIKSRCDDLLVYGYGAALTDHGSLAGFAREVRVRLVDPEPGVRASLAAEY